MNITIRNAGLHDINLICIIATKTFYDTYGPYNNSSDMEMYMNKSFNFQQIKEEIKDVKTKFLLLFIDQELAGYAKLNWGSQIPGCFEETGILELARLYVIKERIGKGIGKIFMEKCFLFAKKRKAKLIWLDVWKKNTRAIDFYKNCGFHIKKEWVFQLGEDLQDDYIMEKIISP